MYKTKHYVVTETGTDLYLKWLEAMKDTNAKVAVVGRVGRIEVGNLAITNFVVTVFGNCRLMLGQASACITLSPVIKSYDCFVVGISKPKMLILTAPARIGSNGKSRVNNEHERP